MRVFRVACLLLVAASCAPYVYTGTVNTTPRAPAISNGEQLVSAMYNRYRSSWFRSITIVMRSSYFRADGSPLRDETWYQAWMPGLLRVDQGDPARGTGGIYRADSNYTFSRGRLAGRRIAENLLLVASFDAYTQPPPRTVNQLRLDGINLYAFRQDTLDGRRVYVIGAPKGDLNTNQIWVEVDRFVLLRAVFSDGTGLQRTTRDLRFENYALHEGGWVAMETRVIVGGIQLFRQEFTEVRVNRQLDYDLFLPERWGSVTHWHQQQ